MATMQLQHLELPAAEVVEKIANLAKESISAENKIHIKMLPGNNDYLITESNGDYAQFPVKHHKSNCEIGNVESAIEFIQTWMTQHDSTHAEIILRPHGLFVSIYNQNGLVTASAKMVILESPEMKALRELNQKSFGIKETVKFLNLKLRDSQTSSVKQLISVLRNCRMIRTKKQTANLGAGRESLGKDIDSEIISEAGNLPEEITFNMPVIMPCFRDIVLNKNHSVRCVVDVDWDTEQIEIRYNEMDLENAKHLSMMFVRENALELISMRSDATVSEYDISFYDGK